MRKLSYAVLDVFAEQALEGNPLAVFADGRGLSTEQLQAIARETNLSETTFVLPREAAVEAERGIRVRIFTTAEELPFAGHPTLGTATLLRQSRPELRDADEVRLELNVGPIPVRFDPPQQGRPGMFATMRQNDPTFGPEIVGHDRAEVAQALGFAEADLGLAGQTHAPVQVVSTGTPFCIVPIRDIATLGGLEYTASRSRQLLSRLGARFFFCVTRGEAGRWRARMQFSGGEDPATGSAAGCLASWMADHQLVDSGAEVILEQGLEIFRPSRLTLRATRAADGRVTNVFVGGRTIRVAEGRLFLP